MTNLTHLEPKPERLYYTDENCAKNEYNDYEPESCIYSNHEILQARDSGGTYIYELIAAAGNHGVTGLASSYNCCKGFWQVWSSSFFG